MTTELVARPAASKGRRTTLLSLLGIGACALACAAGLVGVAGLSAAVASALAGGWWTAGVLVAATATALWLRRRRRAATARCEGSCALPGADSPGCGCASRA